MRLLIVLVVFMFACGEEKKPDSSLDSKQKAAVTAVKRDVPSTDYFEIIKWYKVDTIPEWPDSNVKIPIRYKLDFDYKNTFGTILKKTGVVIFNEKDSVINSTMTDRK